MTQRRLTNKAFRAIQQAVCPAQNPGDMALAYHHSVLSVANFLGYDCSRPLATLEAARSQHHDGEYEDFTLETLDEHRKMLAMMDELGLAGNDFLSSFDTMITTCRGVIRSIPHDVADEIQENLNPVSRFVPLKAK